jgi:UDP-N-acetylglucosamine:LPS N-acetylglucosamine transferase
MSGRGDGTAVSPLSAAATGRSAADPDAAAGPAPVLDADGPPRRLLLVGSSGGHLAQLFALKPWWSSRERLWVTFATPDATSRLRDEPVVWAHFPTTRNIPNLVRNLFLAVGVLRRNRPDVVVSTGAGVAFPFFVVARLMRIRTVYVEVYDRLDSRTLSGRLCRPLSSLFCVQWEEQAALYKGARVVGTLL